MDNDLVHFNGDCKDFLKTIPTEKVKLVVSSPPYNIGKKYESRTAIDDYLEQQSKIIKELYRICDTTGSICWQVGNYVKDGAIIPLDCLFYPIFEKLGMKLRNRIVWRYGHGLHNQKRFSGRYETILWFTKSEDYTFNLDPVRVPSKYPGKRAFRGKNKGKPSGNPLGKNPSDVWDIMLQEWEEGFVDIPNVKQSHCEKTPHPCQFPVELVERCVLALTNEKDWVLDPYSGAGSTLIAALKNGRRAIGLELEEQYFRIATERLELLAQGKLKTRPIGRPIYQPNGKLAQIPDEWIK